MQGNVHVYFALDRGGLRHQLGRGKIGCLLKRRGFSTPNLLLECSLCRVPRGSQLSKHQLTRGGQRPPPLSAVVARSAHNQVSFLNKSQRSRRGCLVDANRIGKIRCREIRGSLQHLQCRVLREGQTTAGE